MSAVGDLMGSIWSSGFTEATLYAFLDGCLSALPRLTFTTSGSLIILWPF